MNVPTHNEQHLPWPPRSMHTTTQNSLPKCSNPHGLRPLFPGSILPKATQPPHVCTLVSRNGQGEAVCSSCGLLQAGCPCKCGPSWCCRWREGRLPSGLYAYSCLRPTNIRVGLPLSITPNYNIRREKKKEIKSKDCISPAAYPFLPLGKMSTRFFPLLQEQIQKRFF